MLIKQTHTLVYSYKHGECCGGQGQEEHMPEDLTSLGGRAEPLKEGTLFLSPEQRVQGKGRAQAQPGGWKKHKMPKEQSFVAAEVGVTTRVSSAEAGGRQEHITDSLEADFGKEFGYILKNKRPLIGGF